MTVGEEAYRRAGVDLEAGHRAVDLIREVAAGATRPEVLTGVGPFAGMFELDDQRLLVASTDGVGTKLEVARLAGRLDTVGIDLVAMSANDVVTTGAEPLFFLDYLAVARLVPEEAAAIVSGVAEGCRRAGCALLGGETAEHPGTLEADRFDLAGFCVGLVRRDDVLGPHRVEPGHVLLGLAASGLHSNGFSLVRRVLLEGRSLEEAVPALARSLGEELLEPTAMYVRPILGLARAGLARSAAHITGGGSAREPAPGPPLRPGSRGRHRGMGPAADRGPGRRGRGAGRGRPVRRAEHGDRDDRGDPSGRRARMRGTMLLGRRPCGAAGPGGGGRRRELSVSA